MPWDDDLDRPLIPDLDVPEHKPVDTGLVDRRGNPIRRQPNPVGFHRPGKARGLQR